MIFSKLKRSGFDHDLEIVLFLKSKNIKINELPVKWIHKNNSSLNIFFESCTSMKLVVTTINNSSIKITYLLYMTVCIPYMNYCFIYLYYLSLSPSLSTLTLCISVMELKSFSHKHFIRFCASAIYKSTALIFVGGFVV